MEQIKAFSFSLLLFYALLYRASLLPRWLMGFANLACVLQLIAMGSTFFQGQVVVLLQLPLLLTQIAVPVYLIVNGIRLPPTTTDTFTCWLMAMSSPSL